MQADCNSVQGGPHRVGTTCKGSTNAIDSKHLCIAVQSMSHLISSVMCIQNQTAAAVSNASLKGQNVPE